MRRLVAPLAVTVLAVSLGLSCNSGLTGDGSPEMGVPDLAVGPACHSTTDCHSGSCVGGHCCSGTACGESCCTGSAVCLYDSCVSPGAACHTTNDCAAGQYCETALGSAPDGGVTRDGGVVTDGGLALSCTQPVPVGGRCLALPPLCRPDGGTGSGCVEACEYHPGPGPLDAVAKWTWGPTAKEFPQFTDVWSTPTVGRVADSNCDGVVNDSDPPNVIFIAGDVAPTNVPRDNGVLRVLDGSTGTEVWSLRAASAASKGFLGVSLAIGDIDGDGLLDVLAITGEGYVVLINNRGQVVRTSDKPIDITATTGWGGGLAVADMDGDGFPEIAFGNFVYTTTNHAITQRFKVTEATGGGADQQTSTFADMDGAPGGHQELVAGRAVYKSDGSVLWNRPDLPDGFPAVADMNSDGKPEVVMVASGQAWILEGATGKTLLGPAMLGGTGNGGPPTLADFDRSGSPQIGVAQATMYTVLKPDWTKKTLNILWSVPNHDLSSAVTGSSLFDFEGAGRASVIYGDECFLWVFEGATGKVRFATPHTSFTATEASVVADVDGDGRAEILMVSNGADPSGMGWKCDVSPWNQADTATGRPAWVKPTYGPAYRGIVAYGDRANAWVGTRTLWNQHAYHVTNICDPHDSACDPSAPYGSIPKVEKVNWQQSWLNNYRQNVQDKGLFNAPDAVVSLSSQCAAEVVLFPVVRNIGQASLPAGVVVRVFKQAATGNVLLGSAQTTHPLLPGQAQQLTVAPKPGTAAASDLFVAQIYLDPNNITFRECRTDNDTSNVVPANCLE